VNRLLFLIFFQFVLSEIISAQVVIDSSLAAKTDTLRIKDSINNNRLTTPFQKNDSTAKKPTKDTGWQPVPPISIKQPTQQIFMDKPAFNITRGSLNNNPVSIKKFEGKESFFYILVGLLLFFTLLRQSFPKYFSDLFRLFFRTTIKQRQIREQLMQTPLPSLLMNVFFVLTSGLYVNFLLLHFGLRTVDNFWLRFFYCSLFISLIYIIKFIGLKISGWIFNMQEAADYYIFIVFIINKIIGIFLLPFLVFLAFMNGSEYSIALMLSWWLIGILLVYRVILTYSAVRNQVKVNPFHFFLYFCAFEIAPLLLIYKALLVFLK